MPDMYTLLALGGLLFFAVAAFYFWDRGRRDAERVNHLTDDKTSLEDQVSKLKDELADIKPKLQKSRGGGKKSGGNSSKNSQAKEIKNYKRQVHDLKEEVKALRKQLDDSPAEEATSVVGSQDLMQIREELMEAKTEAANLKGALKAAEEERDKLKADAVIGSKVEEAAPNKEINVAALRASHKQELEETVSSYEEKLAQLKSDSRSNVKQVKDELLTEVKDLRTRVRRLQNDVDQHRRRADNNDKAYKITRLQLESALEKLALVDPETHAPGGFYDPQIEAILKKYELL